MALAKREPQALLRSTCLLFQTLSISALALDTLDAESQANPDHINTFQQPDAYFPLAEFILSYHWVFVFLFS